MVTNYLWRRPLLPTILDSVAPGGVLLYETFAQGNESGPAPRGRILLRPGEWLQAFGALRVVAYEDGFLRRAGTLLCSASRPCASRWRPAGSRLPLVGTP